MSEKQTDAEHVTEVAQAVADRVERAGASDAFVLVYQPGHHFAYNIAQAMFFLLGALSYLTVLLSCFLIINIVTALMNQQTRQIGIIKATGAQNRQIAGMYLVLILGFGMGTLLLAVPLGALDKYTMHGWWEQAALMELMSYAPDMRQTYCRDKSNELYQATYWRDPGWNVHTWDSNKAEHPRIMHATMYPDRAAVMHQWAQQAAKGWMSE